MRVRKRRKEDKDNNIKKDEIEHRRTNKHFLK